VIHSQPRRQLQDVEVIGHARLPVECPRCRHQLAAGIEVNVSRGDITVQLELPAPDAAR
jgi:hypothetical protein